MTERDVIIDGKVKELTSKKEELVESIKNLPAYKTSLRIGGVNLRELTTKNELYDAFKDIEEENKTMKDFESEFGKLDDRRIYGYEYDDWKHDVEILFKKIVLSDTLKKVTTAIKSLDGFVSEDTKVAIKFNSLLDDIAKI